MKKKHEVKTYAPSIREMLHSAKSAEDVADAKARMAEAKTASASTLRKYWNALADAQLRLGLEVE